ncbi:Fur family transcriptional regulator [Salinarimonas ramus]|uniref:Transcriptional repressor n=1 Tax=Salinarimonas ramus TaxID=690164 RepID=A0A917QAP9_9HYPH|nr:Fur family transcriptional regulator [Salinarimonas ramus]GGK38757.1 transcriptional repressor [Salinarimonas ramus]
MAHDHSHHDHPHDHDASCAHAHARAAALPEALATAQAACAERGVRLTPIRRTVLEALLESHAPLGAYEILDALNAKDADDKPGESKSGRGLAPIAIYRALDFLIEQGFVHKLESRNAFTACPHAHAPHDLVAFLICDACGGVDEVSPAPLAQAVTRMLAQEGFAPRRQVLEITGTCAHCHG